MPTVLLVSQPTTEGVAVAVAALARAAVNDGWRVIAACPADGGLRDWVGEAEATWFDLPMTRQPTVRDVFIASQLRQLVAGVDVVHLHSSKAGATGRMALLTIPRARRPKSVFTPHAWSWMVGGRLAPAYRWTERRLASATDAIVAVSDAERDAGLAVLGGRRADRVRVIPNGVDLDRFSPIGPVAPRPEVPLVVCVGRLTRQKGQDVAIRSVPLLRDRQARLRLVGAGPDEHDLRALARDLGVDDRVEFAGLSSDPASHLRAADVVVVPSRWDGLSLSLLEGLACGRPVVATAVPGSAAVDGAGAIVAADDPAALADAVDGLLENGELRDRLGRVARRRAEEEFDGSRRVAEVLDLWRSLLA